MRHPLTEKIKQVIRPSIYRLFAWDKQAYKCPICNYRGAFKDKQVTHKPGMVRLNSKCPGCSGVERHRMLALVFQEVFANQDFSLKHVLHFAPEDCLKPILQEHFGKYSTADLFMPRVDFKEDLQQMSFADGTFDCVVISHVMTSVPDMQASLFELRRILKPGGIAIIAEAFACESTIEYGAARGDFWREVGQDAIQTFERYFSRVESFLSDRYPENHQLNNRMQIDGVPKDDYPEALRIDGIGYKEMVAVCYT